MTKFLNALGFLTVIRIPAKFILKKREFPKSLIYFPLVGLIIGIIISAFYLAVSYIFPLILVVILTVGLEVIFTGGIHLDGLADMLDGTFSGKTEKNKILEIMKRSDIGVFGVLIIIFVIALKISLIYYISLLSQYNLANFFIIIIFMPVFGRWSILYLYSRYEPLRKESSLAGVFSSKNNKRTFIVSTLYVTALFIALYAVSGFFLSDNLSIVLFKATSYSFLLILLPILKSVIVISFTFIFLILISSFFTKRIGGITGDILGGVCVIVEVFYLIISYILLRFV